MVVAELESVEELGIVSPMPPPHELASTPPLSWRLPRLSSSTSLEREGGTGERAWGYSIRVGEGVAPAGVEEGGMLSAHTRCSATRSSSASLHPHNHQGWRAKHH